MPSHPLPPYCAGTMVVRGRNSLSLSAADSGTWVLTMQLARRRTLEQVKGLMEPPESLEGAVARARRLVGGGAGAGGADSGTPGGVGGEGLAGAGRLLRGRVCSQLLAVCVDPQPTASLAHSTHSHARLTSAYSLPHLTSDDDLLISQEVVSLKDPMSGQRMQVGRVAGCTAAALVGAWVLSSCPGVGPTSARRRRLRHLLPCAMLRCAAWLERASERHARLQAASTRLAADPPALPRTLRCAGAGAVQRRLGPAGL